ncbi:unnamed protein product [Closterium sp. Naga37s-1]|nr:unnamed protein product [Closterium sp. Naga37s-1]
MPARSWAGAVALRLSRSGGAAGPAFRAPAAVLRARLLCKTGSGILRTRCHPCSLPPLVSLLLAPPPSSLSQFSTLQCLVPFLLFCPAPLLIPFRPSAVPTPASLSAPSATSAPGAPAATSISTPSVPPYPAPEPPTITSRVASLLQWLQENGGHAGAIAVTPDSHGGLCLTTSRSVGKGALLLSVPPRLQLGRAWPAGSEGAGGTAREGREGEGAGAAGAGGAGGGAVGAEGAGGEAEEEARAFVAISKMGQLVPSSLWSLRLGLHLLHQQRRHATPDTPTTPAASPFSSPSPPASPSSPSSSSSATPATPSPPPSPPLPAPQWDPYIALLPRSLPLPIFFSPAAVAALGYPPLQAELAKRSTFLRRFASEFMPDVVESLQASQRCRLFGNEPASPSDLAWAMGCASSRAFRVPAITRERKGDAGDSGLSDGRGGSVGKEEKEGGGGGGEGMKRRRGEEGERVFLPVIDLANHDANPTAKISLLPDGTAELRALLPLPPRHAITIDYGRLSTDLFLLDYGFAPANNAYDTLPMSCGLPLIEAARAAAGLDGLDGRDGGGGAGGRGRRRGEGDGNRGEEGQEARRALGSRGRGGR